ncbi:hypothetical protein [Thiothrix sp.]|jgi:hypothetical protein|uniref:hypothetical protein n=1 Tax=Thiothrix sp. TaxID=1032 RepID=UPI00257A0297|nr:hypothetical protein [Thiothrix sp.]
MALADKLKERQESKPQAPEEDDKLILGILIPVKFNHHGKQVKGYLNVHPDAVYLGRLSVALEVALEEAGGQIDLNVLEPNSSGGGSNWKQNSGGYQNGGGWKNNGGGGWRG